jgi:hypothetical protein
MRGSRRISMQLAGGGAYNFYEPDKKLSDQMQMDGAKAPEIAIRETAWDYYRVLGYLPNPDKILRKLNKDIDEYEQLLADSRVKAAYNSRRAGTLGLEWSLDQNGCQARAFRVIKSLFDSYPMTEIMAELLNGVFYGYQPVEVLWKKMGGLVLPEQIMSKPARWFRYSDLNELRYLTKRNMITGEPVPERKFLMARYHPSYSNPYGESLASACYWPVKFRHTGFRYMTQFVEKYGMPWVMAQYPLGARKERVLEMIQNLDSAMQDAVIATPEEYKVTALELNKTASSDIYRDFIDLCNTEITMAILGQNLTTEVKGGSYAAAKVHGEVRADLIFEDVRMIENVFNTLIDWIWHYNYSDDTKPKFVMTPKPAPTKDDAQQAVYMTQAGVRFKKEYWQKNFLLTDTEFDVKEPMLPGMGPEGQPGAGALDGGDVTDPGDKNVTEGAHEARDSATNTQTYDATKRLRSTGTYKQGKGQ